MAQPFNAFPTYIGYLLGLFTDALFKKGLHFTLVDFSNPYTSHWLAPWCMLSRADLWLGVEILPYACFTVLEPCASALLPEVYHHLRFNLIFFFLVSEKPRPPLSIPVSIPNLASGSLTEKQSACLPGREVWGHVKMGQINYKTNKKKE